MERSLLKVINYQIMASQEESLSYCFNSKCANSIINLNHSNFTGIETELALSNNFNCPYCGEELISPVLNMMRDSILKLIQDEQSNVVLLDDDLMFHFFVKQSLNKELINAKYYTDGYVVLNQLANNIDNEEVLPDIILLDLNMPILNGWSFLDLFKSITHNLTKKIDIYIISSCADPGIDFSIYPFVKCLISKESTLQFFKMLNAELAERRIGQPSISLTQTIN